MDESCKLWLELYVLGYQVPQGMGGLEGELSALLSTSKCNQKLNEDL